MKAIPGGAIDSRPSRPTGSVEVNGSSDGIFSVSTRNAGLELLYGLIDGEARGTLPGRELDERRHEVANERLHRHHQERSIQHPIPVRVRRDRRSLEGIGAQVEDLRGAQLDER